MLRGVQPPSRSSARRKAAPKHGGDRKRESLASSLTLDSGKKVGVLDVDEGIDEVDPTDDHDLDGVLNADDPDAPGV